MNFLDKLQRKFGKYAIKNLMYYIIILNILGYIIGMINPDVYYQYLMLDIAKVMQGQIWRLFTFILQPPSTNLFFVFIELYLYYMIGNSLENVWGSFRFNMYYLSGILFTILATVIIYAITGFSYPLGLAYVNRSLFFAFAALFPNMQLLLYFIIPIKIKYLAFVYAAIFAYEIFDMIRKGAWFLAIAMVVALGNFLMFFLATRNYRKISPKEVKRRNDFKRQVNQNQGQSGRVIPFPGKTTVARHKCAVCGKTELDDDTLEFRFCSKCDGNYEYCMEHLYTHEHVHKHDTN